MSRAGMHLMLVLLHSAVCASGSDVTIGERTFSHTWKTKTSMPEARSDMSATTVGDKIYLIGGCNGAQEWNADIAFYDCGSITGRTDAYLPLSNEYQTNLSDAPRVRYRHAAAAVDSSIYLFGGTDASGEVVPEVDVLDTVAGTWTTLADPMPNPTTDLAAFVYAGKIYVVGGYTPPDYTAQTRTQVFNPTVSGSSAWTQGAPLNKGRGDTFAVVIGSSAYVLGGFHHDDWSSPLDSVEKLEIAVQGGAWSTKKKMTVGRGDKAIAALHDVIHVVGGETKNEHGHSVPLRDVEVYDPQSNAWYAGGDIPSERFRFTAAAHGESIFIFGGQGYLNGAYATSGSNYPVLATVEEYKETVTGVSESQVNAAAGMDLIGIRSLLALTVASLAVLG